MLKIFAALLTTFAAVATIAAAELTPAELAAALTAPANLQAVKGVFKSIEFNGKPALSLGGKTVNQKSTNYFIGRVKLPRPVSLKGKMLQFDLAMRGERGAATILAFRFFRNGIDKPVWSFVNWEKFGAKTEFEIGLAEESGINVDYQGDRVAANPDGLCDAIEFHVGSRTGDATVEAVFYNFKLIDASPPVYPYGWTPVAKYADAPAKVTHPAGYVKAAEIERARQNLKTPWGKEIYDRIKAQSKFWMSLTPPQIELMIPADDAWGKCICPNCGTLPEFAWEGDDVLQKDLLSFRCTKCGKVFPNAEFPENKSYTVTSPHGKVKTIPYYEGKVQITQGENLGVKYHLTGILNYVRLRRIPSVENAALVYALEGNIDYARRVRDVLVRFARVYPEYSVKFRTAVYDSPRRNHMAGKLYDWKLQDSYVILALLNAYTLTADSGVYSDADKLAIENGICREFKHLMTAFPPKDTCINAIPAHMATAVLCAALTGDRELLDWALEGPDGLNAFIRKYYTRDGHWFEHSASYGNMAANPMLPLALILNGYSDSPDYRGSDRYDHFDAFRKIAGLELIFTGMAAGTLPTGNFPAFNDSNAASRQLPSQLELVAAVNPTPENRNRLAYFLQNYPSPFGGEYALYLRAPGFDLATVSKRPAEMEQSLLYPGGGWAILRPPAASATSAAALYFGPYAGGHSHNSTLGYLYCYDKRETVSDLGYLSWFHPNRDWNNSALAHNIVLVDKKPQGARRWGAVELFTRSGRIQAARFDAANAYPEATTRYARGLYLIPLEDGKQYLIDIFDVKGGAEQLWAFHADGPDYRAPEGLTFKPAAVADFADPSAGIEYIERCESAPLPAGVHRSEWRFTAELNTRLFFANARPMELVKALAPGLRDQKTPYAKVPLHLQLVRAAGPWNRFAAVVESYAGTPGVTQVERRDLADGALELTITVKGGEDVLRVAADGRASGFERKRRGQTVYAWAEGGAKVAGLAAPVPIEGKVLAVDAAKREIVTDAELPGEKLDYANYVLVIADRKDGAYPLKGMRRADNRTIFELDGQAGIRIEPDDRFTINCYVEKEISLNR